MQAGTSRQIRPGHGFERGAQKTGKYRFYIKINSQLFNKYERYCAIFI
jgi:hypothetical protein